VSILLVGLHPARQFALGQDLDRILILVGKQAGTMAYVGWVGWKPSLSIAYGTRALLEPRLANPDHDRVRQNRVAALDRQLGPLALTTAATPIDRRSAERFGPRTMWPNRGGDSAASIAHVVLPAHHVPVPIAFARAILCHPRHAVQP
jgi:hypothetical protein